MKSINSNMNIMNESQLLADLCAVMTCFNVRSDGPRISHHKALKGAPLFHLGEQQNAEGWESCLPERGNRCVAKKTYEKMGISFNSWFIYVQIHSVHVINPIPMDIIWIHFPHVYPQKDPFHGYCWCSSFLGPAVALGYTAQLSTGVTELWISRSPVLPTL